MRINKGSWAILVLAITLTSAVRYAADIAVVDFTDQWTQVDALRQMFDAFKIKYDDLTKDIEGGTLSFEGDNKLFFIHLKRLIVHRRISL